LQQSKALTVQSSDQSNRATESHKLCLRQG
jgi:hypothetical protein